MQSIRVLARVPIMVAEDGVAGALGIVKLVEGGFDVGASLGGREVEEVAGEDDEVGLFLNGFLECFRGAGGLFGGVGVDIGDLDEAEAIGVPVGEVEGLPVNSEVLGADEADA